MSSKTANKGTIPSWGTTQAAAKPQPARPKLAGKIQDDRRPQRREPQRSTKGAHKPLSIQGKDRAEARLIPVSETP